MNVKILSLSESGDLQYCCLIPDSFVLLFYI